ncbi:GNAT family N-acetyltransferase [Adhaeribacter rhizoryzae]|uniref:N-acetyltransferase n=1 Tax=Adhaeribacter rhizoryzae TaxID=2607907 RepID=A0A5M6DRC1_9BACT|nr:GNAT family N-acetyltransferase [Adhaeribacter rhizoryzae]KAA5548799.1 N-acetyltransferase [Adhaeribacter rhizoryzae]
MELEIINNPENQRFETTIDGKTAFVHYKLRPHVITVLHTEVPKELEGRGIAAALSKFVLEYIADQKLKLVPLCPYMQNYLQKHPEYEYLVKE